MLVLNANYRRGLAQSLSAENEVASSVIAHNSSLGSVREKILRTKLDQHTPEPYRVASGFITQSAPRPWTSQQHDVLVYDASVSRPLYGSESTVVIERRAATLVAEVKTTLNAEMFKDELTKWQDVQKQRLPLSMLGFAFDGVSFDTFRSYIDAAAREAPYGLPECIVVHDKNYLYARIPYHGLENSNLPNSRRITKCQFVVDFNAAHAGEGTATTLFLDIYIRLITRPNSLGMPPTILDVCRNLIGSDECIHFIDESSL